MANSTSTKIMPTGYTSELCDNDQSFAKFVLGCARAFGACIEQRDDPLDDLPKIQDLEPMYHETELERAMAHLDALQQMSPKARIKYGENIRTDTINDCEKNIAKKQVVRSRIVSMIDRVSTWDPPTDDHHSLKQFMLDQLNQTLQSDGDILYYQNLLQKTIDSDPISFFDDAVESAKWDISYHTKHNKPEKDNAAKKRKWIQDLYIS